MHGVLAPRAHGDRSRPGAWSVARCDRQALQPELQQSEAPPRQSSATQLRARLLAGPDLATDLDALKQTESQSLLAHLVALRHRLFSALDSAEEADDRFYLTRVVGQLHQNLELTGKLLGDLGVGHTIVNVDPKCEFALYRRPPIASSAIRQRL